MLALAAQHVEAFRTLTGIVAAGATGGGLYLSFRIWRSRHQTDDEFNRARLLAIWSATATMTLVAGLGAFGRVVDVVQGSALTYRDFTAPVYLTAILWSFYLIAGLKLRINP